MIAKLLIANRGEIACRIARTARRMGVASVAVFTEADRDAPHVRACDEAVRTGSYLDIAGMVEAATRSGAHAVHPGYGFLSENADFAEACAQAGIVFVGPSPEAIRIMGDKAAAKAKMIEAGVPVVPGYQGECQELATLLAEAEKIGFPVLIKAAAGGGGRGMRRVHAAWDFGEALASARREAKSAFGNDSVLLERLVEDGRHVEVQVFGDAHGNMVHLYERDCSTQRRHQKIIEEAPSPAVDAALRERLGQCAVALARAAGYVGAGTVEFLLDGSDFYLMEMNTRLQVEHPVTEALTGLDLVEWQIRVARGGPLPLTQDQVRLQGHAIEVRLCAEDEQFHPHTGRVRHWSSPAAAAAFTRAPLRFDHAVEAGSEVSPHYDAMLGKLIVHAATRAEAIDQLAAALGELEVLGLPTNRAFLIECLQSEGFRAGAATIPFLAQQGGQLRESLQNKELSAAAALGPAPVFVHEVAALACRFPLPLRLRHRERTLDWQVRGAGGGSLQVTDAAGALQALSLHPLTDGAVRVGTGGVSRRLRAVPVPRVGGGTRWHAQSGAVDWWLDDLSFEPAAGDGGAQAASELRAPFNGKVVRIAAQPGQALEAGETALVIESMKLEHSLSPRAGATVAEVLVSEGQQVAPGQVLLRFAVQAVESPA